MEREREGGMGWEEKWGSEGEGKKYMINKIQLEHITTR